MQKKFESQICLKFDNCGSSRNASTKKNGKITALEIRGHHFRCHSNRRSHFSTIEPKRIFTTLNMLADGAKLEYGIFIAIDQRNREFDFEGLVANPTERKYVYFALLCRRFEYCFNLDGRCCFTNFRCFEFSCRTAPLDVPHFARHLATNVWFCFFIFIKPNGAAAANPL